MLKFSLPTYGHFSILYIFSWSKLLLKMCKRFVKLLLSLAGHLNNDFFFFFFCISWDGRKLLLIPFPCNYQGGYLVDGVTFNHYTYPLCSMKNLSQNGGDVRLADPILDLTLDSGKVFVVACGFLFRAPFCADKLRHTGV